MLVAVAVAVVVGLLAWAVAARLSGSDAGVPATLPPVAEPVSTPGAVPTGPPPWVRYPTPLEGSWARAGDGGRLTLVVMNSDLDAWLGTRREPLGRLLVHRKIIVVGDQLIVRAPGETDAAIYRWRVDGEQLSLRIVDSTSESDDVVGGSPYHRA